MDRSRDSSGKWIPFIFFITLFASCSIEKHDDPLKDFTSEQTQSLKGEVFLNPEEYGIFKPMNLMYWKNLFIIRDINNTHILHSIDLKSKKIVHGFQQGNGPGEIVSLGSVECQDGQVYLYDIARKILYQTDPLLSMSDTVMHYSEYMRLNTERRPYLIHKTIKGCIATGLLEEGIFMLVHAEQEEPKTFVDYPDFEVTERMTGMEKAAVYIGARVTIKPDQNKLACLFPMAGVISFCGITADSIVEYKRLTYYAPMVEAPRTQSLPAIMYKKEAKVAFCAAASTDEYIYALYSGRTNNDYPAKAHECEHLLVFDWNGNPVKHYQLDMPLFSLSLDAENRMIYGISFQPEGVVVKYNLSPTEKRVKL
jgi:hypothetical protein